ncbi:MAG: DUF1287 domain-containing protein [Chthoniobacterales bacterium]
MHKILLALICCWGIAICHAEGWSVDSAKLTGSARFQVGVTTGYDPEYRVIVYPNGDVPKETGVCSDVVIRALRVQKIDLQKEIHEDMLRSFTKYPSNWGLSHPDTNIDHRRVPNLMTFFKRKGFELPISTKAEDYQPGDIVAWNLWGSITHIGIVSDKKDAKGVPLVIHNIGRGAQEEDALFQFKIIGHYRIKS